MKISTSYNGLVTALKEVMPVLDDKLLQEDAKRILFWVTNGKIKVLTKNLYTTCIADLEGVITYADNENPAESHYIQLIAKELNGQMKSVENLKLTKVDRVDLEALDAESRLYIHEVAADPEMENAEKLTQTTKFRLTRLKLGERQKAEFEEASVKASENAEFITVTKDAIMLYLNALLPGVMSEVRDTVHTRVSFADGFVYVVPQTYALLMKNVLPEGVSQFVVTNSVAKFMQSFMSIEETTQFRKIENGNNSVTLILKNTTASAVIRAISADKAFNITKQKELPQSGIVVSRVYFSDVMRRINTINAEVTFTIKLSEDGNSTCKVQSKAMSQEISVMNTRGTGEFSFTLKPDMLASLICNHINDGGVLLYIYLALDENGKVIISVTNEATAAGTDDHLWHTYAKGLALAKQDYMWEET